MRLLPLSVVALMVGGSAFAAVAGPLDKKLVGADAKWVVHVDWEGAVRSSIGQFVRANPDKFHIVAHMDKVKRETGLDPMSDIRAMTVYAVGGKADGVVVILATTSAADGVFKQMQEHADDAAPTEPKEHTGPDNRVHWPRGYERRQEGGRTIHSWTDDGERVYALVTPAAHPADRNVLLSQDLPTLLKAADVVEGKAANLAAAAGGEGGAAGALRATPCEGSVVFACAEGIDSWIGDKEAGAIAKNARSLVVDLGEHAGELYGDMTVTAGSAQGATDMAQVMQGLLAMGRMLVADKPQWNGLVTFSSGITFQPEGESVMVRCRYKSQDVIDAMKAGLQAPAGAVHKKDRPAGAKDGHKNDQKEGRQEEK